MSNPKFTPKHNSTQSQSQSHYRLQHQLIAILPIRGLRPIEFTAGSARLRSNIWYLVSLSSLGVILWLIEMREKSEFCSYRYQRAHTISSNVKFIWLRPPTTNFDIVDRLLVECKFSRISIFVSIFQVLSIGVVSNRCHSTYSSWCIRIPILLPVGVW